MNFPYRSESQQKGAKGEDYFQFFVSSQLGCVYHRVHQEQDFGVDGYLELVENGRVTGKLVGIQIKCGDSYFEKQTSGGYRYVGEQRHLNYYLNHSLPIFLVILDTALERGNWALFEVGKTSPLPNQKWWIEIPAWQELRTNFREAVFRSAASVVDYAERIGQSWCTDEMLDAYGLRFIGISKREVEDLEFDNILTIMERLSKNQETLRKAHSTLDIFFPEYDRDPRMLARIPEVGQWLRRSVEIRIPWFYFWSTQPKSAGLSLLLQACCTYEIVHTGQQEIVAKYENRELEQFFAINFQNLNAFMERYHLEETLNEQISEKIMEAYRRMLR
ncbi:MAG: DUF4365 and DUF1817 domain-containing protein [Eubacteriales bacterium]|nr:DUF4365 and DUF1817 domain-containing protein [Eubacteriales bacterium]